MLGELKAALKCLAGSIGKLQSRAYLRLQLMKRAKKPTVERREGVRYGLFVIPEMTPELDQIVRSMSHVFVGHGYTPELITTKQHQPCLPHETLRQMAFTDEDANAMSLMILDSRIMNEEAMRLKSWAIDMGMNVAILYPEGAKGLDNDLHAEFQALIKYELLSMRIGKNRTADRIHRVQYSDTGDAIRKLNSVLLLVLKSLNNRQSTPASRSVVA